MKKKILALAAAAVSVVLLLPACGDDEQATALPEQTAVEETQLPPKVENDPAVQEQTEQPDDVIVTAYGKLEYPGMWTDRVQHEVIENGSDVEVHFYSVVEDERIELFGLYYGIAPETAFQCGEVQVEDMLIPISVVTPTIEPKDSWPEGTYDELQSLQESQNDILTQLADKTQ